MSNTDSNVATVAPKSEPAPARPKKTKKQWPSNLPKNAAKADDKPVLSGYVSRIAIQPKTLDGQPVTIEILSKKGARQSYSLNSSDLARHAALLHLATAAFSAKSKLHVETADGPEGTKLAVGLELKSVIPNPADHFLLC